MILVRGESLGRMSETEVQEFIGWSKAMPASNLFDPEIIGYPRCAMLMAENKIGNLAYLPCQTVLMAEGFVPRPDATNRQRAASLGLFDESLARIARSMSIGDVYTYVPFAESDYAYKIMHHGWREIENVRLFKKPTGVKVGE